MRRTITDRLQFPTAALRTLANVVPAGHKFD